MAGLKIATGLAFAGLVGVILLWANATSDVADPAPAGPSVPSGQFDDAPATTTTTTTTGPTVGHLVQGPALRTDTSHIAGTQTVQPTSSRGHGHSRTTTTTPPRTFGPPEVGAPCPAAGLYSFTAHYEPVLCQGNPPVWRRVF